jgi:hypothetical protein
MTTQPTTQPENQPDTLTINNVHYVRADLATPTISGEYQTDPLLLLNGLGVFIRTVTMYYTGRIVAVSPDMVQLHDAAWVSDTGRFHDALTTGELNEVEPFPHSVYINRGAIIDVTRWVHELPRTQK